MKFRDNLFELFRDNAIRLDYIKLENDVDYHIKRTGRVLYINFQMSDSTTDWINNFKFKKVPYKKMGMEFKVHEGFLQCWNIVKPIIKEEISDFYVKEIVITGYSHGGALAMLCHEYCWFHRPDIRDDIRTYAFGAPRVLGHWFMKKEFKKRWCNFTVIRNNNDIVTHLPFVIMGFRHVGKMLKLKTSKKMNRIDSHRPESYILALTEYITGQTFKPNKRK